MTSETPNRAPAADPFHAWQQGVAAMFGMRGPADGGAGIYGMRLDNDRVRGYVEGIIDGTRDVTNAQLSLAGEWMRAPLWWTGSASPTGLQEGYTRLFQAYNRLFQAYMRAAPASVRETASAAGETATASATRAVQETTRAAESMTRNVRAAQATVVETAADAVAGNAKQAAGAAADVAKAANRSGARAVDQALEVAEEAEQRAERQQREAQAAAEQQQREAEAAAEWQQREAAAAAEALERNAARERLQAELATRPIKGVTARGGEKVYHIPGQSSYERIEKPEQLFADELEAQAAGYRRSETPGGGKIKGNVSRDGSKIYHMPGQANYDRIDAEVLFETEEQAQAAGFRASQR